MITLLINGQTVQTQKGNTIFQACLEQGIEIPRFCYHEKLSIAGNCRMCLVEIEKNPKPVASCAMPVIENMVVFTESTLVKKARENVLEFLLINHPLDCPICDQGGECDLQDQSMIFGSDRTRFFEYKRSVEDKNCGPLIQTVMTRCIHCTRCVRFLSEVAGFKEFGTIGRGNSMEIGTYLTKNIFTELSGNIIDLCPVGALTAKPSMFVTRPWELISVESIDILDPICSNIKINKRGNEILRILPKINPQLNEDWITDKTRFAFDGIKQQRLANPYFKEKNELNSCSWFTALSMISYKLKETPGSKIKVILGDLVDYETVYFTREVFNRLGCYNITNEKFSTISTIEQKINYSFNTKLQNIEETDVCLIVGLDLQKELPLLNSRLRKASLVNNTKFGYIGQAILTSYSCEHLGLNLESFLKILEGKSTFSLTLANAIKPSIIISNEVLKTLEMSTVRNLLSKYTNLCTTNWNGFNVVNLTVGQMATNTIGLFSENVETNTDSNFDLIYVIGANHNYTDLSKYSQNSFIVYQGHHADNIAAFADIILPSTTFFEKQSTFVNIEGLYQTTVKAIDSFANSREDWQILKALFEIFTYDSNYTNISNIEFTEDFNNKKYSKYSFINNLYKNIFTKKKILDNKMFKQSLDNFYMSDSISRHSIIMGQCTKQLYNNYTQ